MYALHTTYRMNFQIYTESWECFKRNEKNDMKKTEKTHKQEPNAKGKRRNVHGVKGKRCSNRRYSS